MCCDSGSSGGRYQVWGHVVALGPGVHDVSLAHAAEVHDINNCVVLGSTVEVYSGCKGCWGPQLCL